MGLIEEACPLRFTTSPRTCADPGRDDLARVKRDCDAHPLIVRPGDLADSQLQLGRCDHSLPCRSEGREGRVSVGDDSQPARFG